ncbi:uncharacterized protein FSUBG_10307 [Fusarium subglutinans]|uniref:Uncharacterized protein n=1 Tax=Gibberella subglutinans TaxID=42677 RepID=A0A8H5P8I8_GIBSU|nr:uncharacterized protein FSUBG_10307 [Fusarium subglutinans]KAF5592003.1 hypothetical protein FSUBG_10307 [Fusarium subglutinans]
MLLPRSNLCLHVPGESNLRIRSSRVEKPNVSHFRISGIAMHLLSRSMTWTVASFAFAILVFIRWFSSLNLNVREVLQCVLRSTISLIGGL